VKKVNISITNITMYTKKNKSPGSEQHPLTSNKQRELFFNTHYTNTLAVTAGLQLN